MCVRRRVALITGRRLYEFNAGAMTSRTENRILQPADVLETSPTDAARLGLATGDRVRLRSRHGEAILPIVISDRIRDGELFATFHTSDVFLNRVTGSQCDALTHTPEYKLTAVRVEAITRPAS